MINKITCSFYQVRPQQKAVGTLLPVTAIVLAILGGCSNAGILYLNSTALFASSGVSFLAGILSLFLSNKKTPPGTLAPLPAPDVAERKALLHNLLVIAQPNRCLSTEDRHNEEEASVLPPEMLYIIFSFLSFSDLAVCQQVCTDWHDASQTHPLMKFGKIFYQLRRNNFTLLSHLPNDLALIEDQQTRGVSLWNLIDQTLFEPLSFLVGEGAQEYAFSSKKNRFAMGLTEKEGSNVVISDENLMPVHMFKCLGQMWLAHDSVSGDIYLLDTNWCPESTENWDHWTSARQYFATNITRKDFNPDANFSSGDDSHTLLWTKISRLQGISEKFEIEKCDPIEKSITYLFNTHNQEKKGVHGAVTTFAVHNQRAYLGRKSGFLTVISGDKIQDIYVVGDPFDSSTRIDFIGPYLFAFTDKGAKRTPSDFITQMYFIHEYLFTFSYNGAVRKWRVLKDGLSFISESFQNFGWTHIAQATKSNLIVWITQDTRTQLRCWPLNIA